MSEELIDNLNPPNSDVFYVKKDLSDILVFFRKIETSSFNDILAREKAHEISNQGLEFHDCLQRSIAQSNKLEDHADSVIGYMKILEDPIFSQDRVLDVLKSLLNNTRENMEETQQIKDKYKVIKDDLTKINNEYCENNIRDDRLLKSLPQKKEELKNLEEDVTKILSAGISFMAGLCLLIYGVANRENAIRENRENKHEWEGMVGIAIMFMSLLAGLYFNNDKKTRIRELRREIRELVNLKESQVLTRKEINIEELCKKINSILQQMGAFHTYWETQYNILESLNKNIECNNLQPSHDNNRSEQDRKHLVGPMKERWERVKIQCDGYTKGVRRIINETKTLEN